MSNAEKKTAQGDEGITVSFRLYEPHAKALVALTHSMRAKSPHEVARMLIVDALGQQSSRETLGAVQHLRREVSGMQQALARSVLALLMNMNLDLTEQEIEQWVNEKLMPNSAGGSDDQHQ